MALHWEKINTVIRSLTGDLPVWLPDGNKYLLSNAGMLYILIDNGQSLMPQPTDISANDFFKLCTALSEDQITNLRLMSIR